MVFSSIPFLCVFLPVVLFLCCLLPSIRWKNGLLIIASLLFYAYGEPVYVFLMIISTLANYGFGLALGRGAEGFREAEASLRETAVDLSPREFAQRHKELVASDPRAAHRKALVVAALVVNLGLLGVFKYADMAVGTVNALFATTFAGPNLALPIGISFYTFQALSYVIDVYRRDVDAQRNYARVLLYISFFPQLIAGPIVKYHDIAEALSNRRMTVAGVASGLRRFSIGLAKKVLIANTMAVAVDAWYAADPSQLNMATAWLMALAYCLQIYYDFSGYSDMAIGLGRMFGFEFKENFNRPYLSVSIKDFWRRWHISLSTWFKEYLYIPLGGNRKGEFRAAMNRICVFFLCGLWHGASWTFVLWGLYHGAFLMLEQYIKPLQRLPRWLGHVYAIVVVTVGFVLFRADTLGQAGAVIAIMFTGADVTAASLSVLFEQLTPLFIAMFALGVVAIAPWPDMARRFVASHGIQAQARVASYVGALVLLAVALLELSAGGYNPFIYFRF